MNEPPESVSRYPDFRPSADTSRLYHFLEEAEEGRLIPYAVLNTIIGGRDSQKTGRNVLNSARRLMQREHGVLFEVIANKGIVRLSNDEKLGPPKKRLLRIHRQAKRGRSELKTVDYAQLSDSAKVEHNVTMSSLGALGHFSGASAARKLAAHVSESQQTVSIKQLVSLFANGRKKPEDDHAGE